MFTKYLISELMNNYQVFSLFSSVKIMFKINVLPITQFFQQFNSRLYIMTLMYAIQLNFLSDPIR